MAITGTNSENKDMRFLAKELQVDGKSVVAPTAGGAIANLALTGTYATDDDNIQAAVNGILAALRTNGIIASS